MSQPAREHFVPLSKHGLADRLADRAALVGTQRAAWQRFAQRLETLLHVESHARLETLKHAYAPLDPDQIESATPTIDPAVVEAFFQRTAELFEKANYRRLPESELRDAVQQLGEYGIEVKIDLQAFQRLEVYARGSGAALLERRSWRHGGRMVCVEAPIYPRLAVVFQQPEAGPHSPVFLKLFKDIPKPDLELLLPGGKIRMSWLDRAKVLFPTVAGLTMTLAKLWQALLSSAVAGLAGSLALLGLAGGAVGYGVKSFLGYLRTRDRHQLRLTRRLYFGNLDNNAGVLFRLLDEAEEQEYRETVLAWFFLWREAGPTGWTTAELDTRIEHYLFDECQVEIDFEIADAVQKLLRFGLAQPLPDGRLRAIPLAAALATLEDRWNTALFDVTETPSFQAAIDNDSMRGRHFSKEPGPSPPQSVARRAA